MSMNKALGLEFATVHFVWEEMESDTIRIFKEMGKL